MAVAGTRCGSTASCQSAYYALDSTGPSGTVRVVVLDDTGQVEPSQLEWLQRQLPPPGRSTGR